MLAYLSVGEITKRRRITGLSIKETSGVDRGANRSQVGGDGWMVMKHDGTPVEKAKKCPECGAAMLPGADTCPKGHKSTAKEAPMPAKLTGRAADLVKAAAAVAVAKAAVEANPNDAAAIAQLEQALRDVTDASTSTDTGTAGGADELTTAQARIAELEAQLAANAPAPSEEAALAKAMETLPEPVRKALEKAQTDAAKAQADATAAIAKAEIERDARLTAEYEAKAQPFAKAAATTAEKLGPVLRSIKEKAGDDALAEVERILRGAAAIAEAGDIFRAAGQGSGEPSSAWEAVRAEAEKFRVERSAAGETLTIEQAIDRVTQLKPELVAAYRKERG